jgi:hypothetical protein
VTISCSVPIADALSWSLLIAVVKALDMNVDTAGAIESSGFPSEAASFRIDKTFSSKCDSGRMQEVAHRGSSKRFHVVTSASNAEFALLDILFAESISTILGRFRPISFFFDCACTTIQSARNSIQPACIFEKSCVMYISQDVCD